MYLWLLPKLNYYHDGSEKKPPKWFSCPHVQLDQSAKIPGQKS
jgi:hypothetical protein